MLYDPNLQVTTEILIDPVVGKKNYKLSFINEIAGKSSAHLKMN